ncbi:MAG: GspE/PulE family protein [Planctomycetaceae bacterium]
MTARHELNVESLELQFQASLPKIPPTNRDYVPQLVESILSAARTHGASDVHLRPTGDALEMLWRIDGALQPVYAFSPELAPKVIARLKVLAELLTYQTETPQEGRIRDGSATSETRLSTFPTIYGEKGVLRIFADTRRYQRIGDLGLAPEIRDGLSRLLGETSGLILITGPAGSGKTTSNYACLREILNKSRGSRSLVSLEDPIESAIAGVDQSQVNSGAGFDLLTGLRSLVRQDPEVIMVGEIRDRSTAEVVFQASLTGHLVLTTFHAGSSAGAVSRLSDMGIEPYLLRSGILAILSQRLLRQLCDCAQDASDSQQFLGLPVSKARLATGCEKCAGTGYRGRFVVAEMLEPQRTDMGRAILARSDSSSLEAMARKAGMISQYERACHAVEAGRTSPEELIRVFGAARNDAVVDAK